MCNKIAKPCSRLSTARGTCLCNISGILSGDYVRGILSVSHLSMDLIEIHVFSVVCSYIVQEI